MSDHKYITVEKSGKLCVVTLNRPEVYNALNRDSKLELIKALRTAGKDPAVLAIILAGTGKAFCTGQDLNDRTVQGSKVDLGNTLETEWNPLMNAIRGNKKIVIGAINGVTAGAGLSIALACDLLVAKPGIQFISGFSKIGLCPDAGSTYTLTRALGSKRALEFFLTNKPYTSDELCALGLINRVHEEVLSEAKKLAEQFTAMAPLAIEAIKQNIALAQEQSYKASMQNETYTQRFLGNSADYQEGLKAFFEKRKANFTGL